MTRRKPPLRDLVREILPQGGSRFHRDRLGDDLQTEILQTLAQRALVRRRLKPMPKPRKATAPAPRNKASGER